MLIDVIVNHLLKMSFGIQRPYNFHEGLSLLPMNDWVFSPDLSFPCAATEASVLFVGLFIFKWKSAWIRLLGIVCILFASFAPLYLGIHYPMDIVAGWIVGFVMLCLFLWLYRPIERALKRASFAWVIALLIVVPFVIMFVFFQYPIIVRDMASAVGIAIVLAFSFPYKVLLHVPKNPWEKIARSLVGILGVFFIFFGLLSLFKGNSFVDYVITAFIPALWLSFFASLSCRYLFEKKAI